MLVSRIQEFSTTHCRDQKDQIVQNGCRTQQATKPQTLSYAMIDSPVGVAAWILEKMYGWCDLTRGNEELPA